MSWEQPTLWQDADDEAKAVWLAEHRLNPDEQTDTDEEDRP